ncbi:MAG: putative membrane protein [Gammaproteobacteria bacterium]|jgi:putative membrane protein
MNTPNAANKTVPCLRTAAIALTTTAPSQLWAQQGAQGYGPHMWDGGSWMFSGPMMMLIVIVIVIVLLAALLLRWFGGSDQGQARNHTPRPSPVDILKERFARGELDKEEYEERRRVLGE